jgi:hypothetical protein
MALDFPNSPTVGQLFPSPSVAGTPVWRWDGTAWQAMPSTTTALKETDYQIAETHASNAVTFAVKTMAGADPSAGDPVIMKFRNGSGGFVFRTITAALSITIPAGATLQWTNALAGRVWIAAFDDAGTVRLAVGSFSITSSGAYSARAPFEDTSITTVAISSSSNAWYTFYSAVAITTARFWRFIGYATYESGLATVGNWAVSPDRIEICERGTPRPGSVIKHHYDGTSSGGSLSNTTLTGFGVAFQWNVESAANLIKYRVEGYIYLRAAVANMQGTVFLMRGGGKINNNPANYYTAATTDGITCFALQVFDKPNTRSTVTYQPAAQNVSTGVGLVQYSTWSNTIEEIMG